MSDILSRTIFTNTDNRTRDIQFVSRTKPVKILMNIKETKDRIIITRTLILPNKRIKKIELIDI